MLKILGRHKQTLPAVVANQNTIIIWLLFNANHSTKNANQAKDMELHEKKEMNLIYAKTSPIPVWVASFHAELYQLWIYQPGTCRSGQLDLIA